MAYVDKRPRAYFRDTMQALRDTRRLKHQCTRCGVQLAKNWPFVECKTCQEKHNAETRAAYQRRRGGGTGEQAAGTGQTAG